MVFGFLFLLFVLTYTPISGLKQSDQPQMCTQYFQTFKTRDFSIGTLKIGIPELVTSRIIIPKPWSLLLKSGFFYFVHPEEHFDIPPMVC